MVKRREPPTKQQPTAEAVEAYAARAEDEKLNTFALDPGAKRDYKAIRLPFNAYEYKMLEKAAQKSGRSKLNFIRWAIIMKAKEEP